MLRDIPKMLQITRAVVDAVKLPVTVKTRLGWDCNSKIIVDLAEQLQDCGIAALTVHGRTRSQMYTGEADWSEIARVKANPRLKIPVIGNGDITTPERLVEAFEESGVDGVMVGRASIGAPWIFREMTSLLRTGEIESISVAEKFALLRRQIRESVERIDEYRGILHIRRHLAASPLFKSIPNFRPTRIQLLGGCNCRRTRCSAKYNRKRDYTVGPTVMKHIHILLILLLVAFSVSADEVAAYRLKVQNFSELTVVDGVAVDYHCRQDSIGWAVFLPPPTRLRR